MVAGDAKKLPFSDDSFDCVVATEVIEHLTEVDGEGLLAEMHRVGNRAIVGTIPNGFLGTNAGPSDNPDETDLSGHSVSELVGIGIRSRVHCGIKDKLESCGWQSHDPGWRPFSEKLLDLQIHFRVQKARKRFPSFLLKTPRR